MRQLEDKAKEQISFIDVTSGPDFPAAKVTTLEGHQSEVSYKLKFRDSS